MQNYVQKSYKIGQPFYFYVEAWTEISENMPLHQVTTRGLVTPARQLPFISKKKEEKKVQTHTKTYFWLHEMATVLGDRV